MKPYSESCAQNQGPILEVLQKVFQKTQSVLEIGSGTGQHAIHFARKLPHLTWQTSDRIQNHEGIIEWLLEAGLKNTLPPLTLEVKGSEWPKTTYDGIFSANTTHIMSWQEVEAMFMGIGLSLREGGFFCLYGPFNYQGKFTSKSNEYFNQMLQSEDPSMGVRNFEDLNTLANAQGLQLFEDFPMPANNRTLVWRKLSSKKNS
jgi:cyclopropane fatty-acyl-phospholipid synthase-like methyltransferase